MKKYTHLFIDFDDTLYDTHGNACIALDEIFHHFNLGQYFAQPSDFSVPYWKTNVELWDLYAHGHISRDYLMVERFRRPLSVGMGNDVSAEFCLQVSDVFLDRCAEKSGVIPGAHDLMDHLAAAGYSLHLCSNGFHEVQYRKLNASGLMKYFQLPGNSIILSEDAGANKPSLQFFDFALSHSHAPRQSTLMIGDNPVTDIAGAKASGLDTLFFSPANAEAPAAADYVAHSLAQIAQML